MSKLGQVVGEIEREQLPQRVDFAPVRRSEVLPQPGDDSELPNWRMWGALS